MTRFIASPRRSPLFGIGPAIAALRGIAHRFRVARGQRAARAQLANLTDRLRQDIGLDDSSPLPADLLERFHRSRQTPPREHESRYRLWA